MKTRTALAGALALTALVAAPAAASASPACAGAATGGEWRSYGRDHTGQRFQRDEHRIDAAAAGTLAPTWSFAAPGAGATGVLQSTPTVADGCVFLGTSTGWALALNADTGEVVWKTQLPVAAPASSGAGVVGAPAAAGGLLYLLVSDQGDGDAAGPYVAALDERSGAIVWRSTIETAKGAHAAASAMVFDGVVFAGFEGDETRADTRGGFALLDASSGALLARTYTTEDPATPGSECDGPTGACGGSIRATPVMDDATGFAYVGTGNPTGDVESPRTDAVVKVDMRRTVDGAPNPGLGAIVDSVKGTPDAVAPATPLCGALHSPADPGQDGAFSANALAGCARGDYDFGASPNVIAIRGHLGLAELQQSGVVHAVRIDGPAMQHAWSATAGPGFFLDNLSTSASDGTTVYVTAGPPGQLIALDSSTGRVRWAAPVADLLHFQSVSVANGVVYTVDSYGELVAYDASDGTVLLRRDMAGDGGDASGRAAVTGVGVAIARGSVFAADGDYVIRYDPAAGGASGGGGPAIPPLPDLPVKANTAIVAGPGGNATGGYLTPRMVVTQGGSVTFANADAQTHNVVSDTGLFQAAVAGTGTTKPVEGVAALAPGDYPFHCSIHPNMHGVLTVVGAGTARTGGTSR